MKFTIVTTVRNNCEMIKEAIKSVSSQQQTQYEHIIIDGNSSDGTKEYLLSLRDPFVEIKSEGDKGIYDALNKGLLMSSSDILGILHSDDLFYDEFVLRDVHSLFENGADVVYADLQYVARTDINRIIREWKSGPFEPGNLIFGWMPPHPTFFFKRELIQRVGLYDLNYQISADYEFMLRFLLRNDFKISYLPRPITKMRVGGISNRNLKSILKKSYEDYLIIESFSPSPLGTLLLKNLRKLGQFRHLVLRQ